ncbi:MAG: GTP 3',8-cyclase MoaA [Lachnospiraceae bacterium]|nr:GTP 3',8-cyclase MoaA [Lachnospiraceae bacterium]
MKDQFGRDITYLRLSVTDRCNLRCRYCMPEEGVCKLTHNDMLTEDEMIMAVEAAASLGITKLRITGGEPLVKKNIVSICTRACAVPGITETAITTNGILLPELAKPLREAGIQRINLSLDTLDAEKYSRITRRGELTEALAGFRAALDAGFEKIKINAVLIGGFNDDEVRPLAELTKQYPIDVRFIELMPMYDSGDFGEEAFISCDSVLEQLPEAEAQGADGGVAKLYRLPGALGNVGLISPVSSHFCGSCNRIRLTADGRIKPCLHSDDEIRIKGMSKDEMTETLKQAIFEKPKWHGEMSYAERTHTHRDMNQIGG